MSVSEQARNFFLFFIIGLFIGFIFDLFRGFRKSFKMKNIFVDIQDIIFLIISGAMFFKSAIVFCNGDIRFYIIFSTILGISIYFLTISETCVIITVVILNCIKILIKNFIKLIKFIYNAIIKKTKKHKIKEKQFWKIFLSLKRFVELLL